MRRAAELYEQSGTRRALYNLAFMYDIGDGVEEDFERAAALYRQSADLGFQDAQFSLGEMYREGRGVPQDDRRAMALFKQAAQQGHDEARSNLIVMHAEQGSSKNALRAFRLLEPLVEQGDAAAQYQMGRLYLEGHGVAKDVRRAFELLQLSADQGCNKAQFSLAVCLFYGEDVPQNVKLAHKLCKRAAQSELALAIELLPEMAAALEPPTCSGCAAVEPTPDTYRRCGQCRVARYCGPECQPAHWREAHKKECVQMKDLAAAAKRSAYASAFEDC